MAVLVLSLSVFGLAACGGEAEQQKEAQQAPQKAAGSGSGAERGLVGTWEVVETDLGPDMGGGLLTFSSDGTFESQPLPEDAPDIVLSGGYRVDGSHIYFIDPETGAETQTEYTLNGDTLTTHTEVEDPEFPISQTATYKRKS
jgi:hypothetical protein